MIFIAVNNDLELPKQENGGCTVKPPSLTEFKHLACKGHMNFVIVQGVMRNQYFSYSKHGYFGKLFGKFFEK